VHCTKSISDVVPPNGAARLTWAGVSVYFGSASFHRETELATGSGCVDRRPQGSPPCQSHRQHASENPGTRRTDRRNLAVGDADIDLSGAPRQHAGCHRISKIQHYSFPCRVYRPGRNRIAGSEALQQRFGRDITHNEHQPAAAGQESNQCGGYSVCCTARLPPPLPHDRRRPRCPSRAAGPRRFACQSTNGVWAAAAAAGAESAVTHRWRSLRCPRMETAAAPRLS
jgi:hypothetical protein